MAGPGSGFIRVGPEQLQPAGQPNYPTRPAPHVHHIHIHRCRRRHLCWPFSRKTAGRGPPADPCNWLTPPPPGTHTTTTHTNVHPPPPAPGTPVRRPWAWPWAPLPPPRRQRWPSAPPSWWCSSCLAGTTSTPTTCRRRCAGCPAPRSSSRRAGGCGCLRGVRVRVRVLLLLLLLPVATLVVVLLRMTGRAESSQVDGGEEGWGAGAAPPAGRSMACAFAAAACQNLSTPHPQAPQTPHRTLLPGLEALCVNQTKPCNKLYHQKPQPFNPTPTPSGI